MTFFFFLEGGVVCVQNGIAGSYGNSIFSFLRNLHIIFHSHTSTYIPTNSLRGFPFPFSLRLLQRLLFVDFLIMAIWMILRWYLIAFLICISLIISDVEHFLNMPTDHLYIFSGEISVKVFSLFFIWVICC